MLRSTATAASVLFRSVPTFSSLEHTVMPIHALSTQRIAHRLWRRQPAPNAYCTIPAAHVSARAIIAPQAIARFHLARQSQL
jgi:hypothetical protein